MPDRNDELGALWRKDGRRGEYWTGKIKIAHAEASALADDRGEIAVVAFIETEKRNDRAPDVRIYISRPREDQPAAPHREAPQADRRREVARSDDLDDEIPF